MVESIKDNGKTTWKKVKVTKNSPTSQSMMARTKKENRMAMESTNGKTEKSMKDSGSMD